MKPNDILKKIEALKAEQAATEAMLNDYPSDMREPDLLVWHHSKLCEFSMAFRIKNLDEALDIIGAWWNHPQVEILPLSLSRGTFTTFRTPAHETERGQKTSEPVFPVTVKVSHWNLTFEFYAMIEGHLISVDVEFEYGGGFQRYASVRFPVIPQKSRQGRDTVHVDKSTTILSTPAFTGYQRIKWGRGSGEYPHDFTLYWPNAESLLDLFTEEVLS